jgi:PhnB protein
MSIETSAPTRELHGVSPHLVCGGAAEAINFYKRAFGAEELTRLPEPDGKIIHACLRINGATVTLSDEFPDFGMVGPARLGGSPVTIHLPVPDVDAAVARAVAAGATVMLEVEDQLWGERYGSLRDPFGHNWSLGTPLGDLASEEFLVALAAVPGSPA